MTIPLIVLAIPSALIGLVGVGGHDSWFAHLLAGHAQHGAESAGGISPIVLMIPSVIVALIGILVAYLLYGARRLTLHQLMTEPEGLKKILVDKYYVDEAYNTVIVQPIKFLSTYVLWKVVDVGIIDGIVNLVGWVFRGVAAGLRLLQTGRVQAYAISVLIGITAILGYYLFLR